MNNARTRAAVLSALSVLAFVACGTSGRGAYFAADDAATTPAENEEGGEEEDGGRADGDGRDAARADGQASDGSKSDAKSNDGAANDAAVDSTTGPGPRVTCAGNPCRSDQSCVQNQCVFSCAGATVPGDYATVTGALQALVPTGNDITICVKNASQENVNVVDPAQQQRSVRIIGLSSSATGLGQISIGAGFFDVELVGLHARRVDVRAPKATLRALRIENLGQQSAVDINPVAPQSTVLVDGCSASAVFSGAVMIGAGGGASSTIPFDVAVQNSYLHGSADYGVHVYGLKNSNVTLLNNTFDGPEIGLMVLSAPASTATVAYYNNAFINHTIAGVSSHPTGTMSITHGNNALFANVANYAGSATDGAGYVKADCMLELLAGVLQPKSGSPCIAAGDATMAPDHDYWNAPRGGAVDIGAVERP